MLPLLALLAAPTLLEGCALLTAVVGVLKLGLDPMETARADPGPAERSRAVKICAVMNVWNAASWVPFSLRSLYPFVETIVVCEACWVPGDWEGATSPDGTAAAVHAFIRDEDPAGKVTLVQAGRVASQPVGRNAAVRAIPRDTDWVWQVDADEFYTPDQAAAIRRQLAVTPPVVSCYNLPARCFYFDFHHCKPEHFTRLYRYYPGFRCTQIASFSVQGQTVTVREAHFGREWSMLPYFHYSYVSAEWTRLKACMGEDVTPEAYRRWWETVYQAYDGTPESLAAISQANGGGVHVMGGGPLELYGGPHPAVLDTHPLRHVRWGRSVEPWP